jgi:hypothetical protein
MSIKLSLNWSKFDIEKLMTQLNFYTLISVNEGYPIKFEYTLSTIQLYISKTS